MSSGCVHQKASLLLASGFIVGGLLSGDAFSVSYAVGALSGIILTPDIDVDNGYIGNTIIRNRLGKVAERAWDGLWFFYRKSLKHGSELSHFPIISTIFRLAYLYFFLLIIPYTLLGITGAWDIEQELCWWNNVIISNYHIVLALMGSDLIHWALDVLTTEHKKGGQVARCNSWNPAGLVRHSRIV